MKRRLSIQITWQIVLVIFSAMLVYATWNVIAHKNGLLNLEVLLGHAGHTLALGMLVFLLLEWRLRSLIIYPIWQISHHGHEISEGIFEKKSYPRTNNEIEEIMDTLNLISEKMAGVRESQRTKSISAILDMIRHAAKDPSTSKHIKYELQEAYDGLLRLDISASWNDFKDNPEESGGITSLSGDPI